MLKRNNLLSHSKLPLRMSNITIDGRLRKRDDRAWKLIRQRWEVVKDADDECSDREWEDMKVVKKEVVNRWPRRRCWRSGWW
jgi:hypothetical protein